MNSCVIGAIVLESPVLRYDQDLAILSWYVEVPAIMDRDQPGQIKAIAFGQAAETINAIGLVPGTEAVIHGRVETKSEERPEGFNEVRARVVASSVIPIGATQPPATPPQAASRLQAAPTPQAAPPPPAQPVPQAAASPAPVAAGAPTDPPDYDNIPFARPLHSRSSVFGRWLDPWELGEYTPASDLLKPY
ncbi:MAG: hypothetical protein AAGF24_00015 [Cyanobacteria bacterium P01_H01_bin.121]